MTLIDNLILNFLTMKNIIYTIKPSFIKDLDILYNSKLLFNSIIFAIFGLVKSNCKIQWLSRIKCPYTSIILSFLEYAPLFWDSNNISHNDQLEKIQNKILHFIRYKRNIPRSPILMIIF